jgi:hypothetical protein
METEVGESVTHRRGGRCGPTLLVDEDPEDREQLGPVLRFIDDDGPLQRAERESRLSEPG